MPPAEVIDPDGPATRALAERILEAAGIERSLVDQPGWGELLERNHEQLGRQRNIYYSGTP